MSRASSLEAPSFFGRLGRRRHHQVAAAGRRFACEALEPRRLLTALPTGFTEALVTTASDLSSPTAMTFSPTGQLWVLEQGGRAKLVRGDGTTHTALTLTVDSAGERGLLGVAFDPAYDGAGPNADRVFLYYTTPRSSTTNPSHNRLSRFTVTGAGTSAPTLGSEVVVRELPPENEDNNLGTNGDTNHNGGAIHFGPDGKLYVAVGDHNYDTTPQANHVSQTLTTPFGKMLRLNPDGSNPSDNPFYDGGTTNWRGAVWAMGLRNPYTFAFQPGTGRVFINDVGEGVWEEINDGAAGANYGWAGSTSPLWEGFESPAPPWANYRDPFLAYDHGSSAPTPPGCAITGGAFYPSGGSFGSAYAGKYFFADYCGNFIRTVDPARPGSAATPDTSSGFASGTASSPVDLAVDAAGNLYYLSRGGTGEVYRISAAAQAPAVTQQPADATAAPGESVSFSVAASGTGPLAYQWQKLGGGGAWANVGGATSATLTFANVSESDAGQYRAVVSNAAGSANSNPATLTVNVAQQPPSITGQPGDQSVNVGQAASFSVTVSGSAPLAYQWQKRVGDTWADVAGATAATYTIASAATADAGAYRVRVSNAAGAATSDAASLAVNQYPTAGIAAPATYTFGETIAFSGTASDPEGGTLPASAYTWRVDIAHDAHFHPHVASFGGRTSGSFVADFNEPDPDQFYRVVLTVTDSSGAAFTTSRDVLPVKVRLTLASSPAGVPLALDGQPVDGPADSVVGSPHTVQAPPTATVSGATYDFVSWSDGGAVTHTITTPAADATYTATYAPSAAPFSAKVNFQDATSQGFAGYLADTGAVFGSRGNGHSYGWNADNKANARNRNASASPDERYDTFNQFQDASNPDAVWELAVPAGTYTVRLVTGDPTNTASVYRMNVEGVLAVDGKPTSAQRWSDNTVTVDVSDGRLTVRSAAGASNNKINFIEVGAARSPFRQDGGADGLVVMEAENYDGNVGRGGKAWTRYTATAGYSGTGAFQATPNTGVNNDTNYVFNSPRLDFRVNFAKAGVHYVWVRGRGAGGADDSVHVGLDGQAVATADRVNGLKPSYGWTRSTGDGPVATVNVAAPGPHTVNLWMREDGAAVDKLLLTTAAAYAPSGPGPAESPRGAAAAANAAAVARRIAPAADSARTAFPPTAGVASSRQPNLRPADPGDLTLSRGGHRAGGEDEHADDDPIA